MKTFTRARPLAMGLALAILPASVWCAGIGAVRFNENPLITVNTAPSLGDNVNGPSIILAAEVTFR